MAGNGETRSSPVCVLPCSDDTVTTCHMCRAVSSLRTEWSQGDVVCTSCGMVHVERVMDSGPEWREYDNDDSGNTANRARSGMIATDESKYVGGLQPTSVSRYCFGAPSSSSVSYGSNRRNDNGIAQRLWRANVRVDRLVQQRHKDAFTNAALNLKLMRKRQSAEAVPHDPTADTDTTDACTIQTATDTAVTDDVEPDYGSSVVWMEERPEFEQQLLEQEELVARQRQALFADKWSLERAKQWHDAHNGAATLEPASQSRTSKSALSKADDTVLWTAARDLYTCYQMLVRAGTTLDLPPSVTDEAATLLCQFAARRDGLKVKGVAAASSSATHPSIPLAVPWSKATVPSPRTLKRGTGAVKAKTTSVDVKEQQQMVRDANKQRQMGALCAALLFWTARHRQRPRSLVAVCDSIVSTEKVQRKHCSRAMNDLKEYFPELATMSFASSLATRAALPHSVPLAISVQTAAVNATNVDSSIHRSQLEATEQEPTRLSSVEAASVANFAEHAVRKLNLPPVAEASIRFLVLHHLANDLDESDGKKAALKTVCAALTYFVCRAGTIMQQLAAQSQDETKKTTKRKFQSSKHDNRTESKQVKLDPSVVNQPDLSLDLFADSSAASSSTATHGTSSTILAEQRAYEMRRMWDAWVEQMPWSRTLVLVEQSTGVSRTTTFDFFKQKLFPHRKRLLTALCAACDDSATPCSPMLQNEVAVLKGTPLASVLLPHIPVAVMLMKADEKV